MTNCDCSEDYGPCEIHGDVLAQREGASTRTADELCAVYLDDALGIDPECLSPYGLDVKSRVDAALADHDPATRCSWLEDLDLAEELHGVVNQVESYLDACTYWDDGYRIVKITGGPLLDESSEDDTSSSVSSQHYIDTGRYLTKRETADTESEIGS